MNTTMMLWQTDRGPLENQISDACQYFQTKYGAVPTLVIIPQGLPTPAAEGLTIKNGHCQRGTIQVGPIPYTEETA